MCHSVSTNHPLKMTFAGSLMKYRPEIDGLRAVAVVPVILFHAGFESFSGGFVGVDIFFVISGYLITSILIEAIENRTFSFLMFYERRARRILPALFFVMLCSIPFAWMWMLPYQLMDFAQSLIAVSLFASNILFWKESGYFDLAAEEKPMLHTWSLAVEEQYYVLFPVFLFLAWRFGKNRVFWMIVALAAISLVLSEWGWRNTPSANFYLAPTRAWELFAGSITAFIVQKRGVQKNELLSLIGLAAIIFSVLAYDESTPFPSVYALVPVVGVVLLVLFADRETLSARLLSTRTFVGVGLISYSAYLWHQPLFAFARIRSVQEPSLFLMVFLSLLSLILAGLSWKYIEQPFRAGGATILKARSSVFAASILGFVVFASMGLMGHVNAGFDGRPMMRELGETLIINHGLGSDCEVEFNSSPNCYTSKEPEVLLWGDSFAMHLAQGIVASNPNVLLQQHTISACSPILGVAQVTPTRPTSWAQKCIDFNDQVLNWLSESSSVKVVILASPFFDVLNYPIYQNKELLNLRRQQQFIEGQIVATVDAVRKTGAKVVIVSPPPRSGWNIGQCLAKIRLFELEDDSCNFSLDPSTFQFDLLSALEEEVPVYWLHDDICEGGICYPVKGGVFIYRDEGHLSKAGSAYLGKNNDWLNRFMSLSN